MYVRIPGTSVTPLDDDPPIPMCCILRTVEDPYGEGEGEGVWGRIIIVRDSFRGIRGSLQAIQIPNPSTRLNK